MGCGASTAATPATTEAKPVVAASKEATAAGKDLAPVFKQFDTSGDGYLQLDELKRAFRAIGLQKRKGEDFELDEKTFKAFDTNGDGKISLEEFNANLHPKTRAKLEEKLNAGFVFDQAKWDASAKRHAARGEGGVNLSKLFAQFDTDGDGFLDIRELQRAFRAIGMEKRKGEKFELDVETFKSFDTNGDGKVSPEEFETNLHPKTRKAIEKKLNDGWTFDEALWTASAERHKDDPPFDPALAYGPAPKPPDHVEAAPEPAAAEPEPEPVAEPEPPAAAEEPVPVEEPAAEPAAAPEAAAE